MWLLRILKAVALITPFIPARVGYVLCAVAGTIFYLVNAPARRNVLVNLQQVDPMMSWYRRHQNARRVCTTVVTNYYDLIRLRSVDRDTVLNLVEISGLEYVECACRAGQGAIIVSCHLGNFSVMARLPAALGLRAALIAERVEPPALFNYMSRLRSAMGIEVIPPGPSALRQILNLLNENGLLLLAADRDVTSNGSSVNFFGKRTGIPSGPVALAMRTGAPLIPAYTIRKSDNSSRVVIGAPIQLRRTGNWDHDLLSNVRLLAAEMEAMIQTDPGQWAVLQRVWPPTSSYRRSEAFGSADESIPEAREQAADSTHRRAS